MPYFNQKRTLRAYFNGRKIRIKGIMYTKPAPQEQLSSPTVSLDGDILMISTTDTRVKSFVIFVGGVEMATVETNFDLSTLELGNGTHEITVKARASGYKDSEASEAVSYVTAYKDITGYWLWNNELSNLETGFSIDVSVIISTSDSDYTSHFNRLRINQSGINMLYADLEVYNAANTPEWIDQNHRLIKIDTRKQDVTDYYDYFYRGEELEQCLEGLARRLVRFTINGNANYAVEGMTWNELYGYQWDTEILSAPDMDYTDDGYVLVYDDSIQSYCALHYPNGEQVHMDDKIADYEYAAQPIEQETYTVSGMYYFTKQPSQAMDCSDVTFNSNGATYHSMSVSSDGVMTYDDTVVYSNGWIDDGYKHVYFRQPQNVGKAFYDTFVSIAPQGGSSGLSYQLSDDGKYYTCTGGSVSSPLVIASELNGVPVRYVAERAFYDKRVYRVVLPDNISLRDNVFSRDTSVFGHEATLTSVTFYGRCYMDSTAFVGQHTLSEVHITDLKRWCDSYFDTWYMAWGMHPMSNQGRLYLNNMLIEGELIIPSGVTTISASAFFNITTITNVVIPESVTSIGDRAFSSCDNLTNIVIPESVTSIGDHAFYNSCANVKSIFIPKSVTTMGENAFGSGSTTDKNCTLYCEVRRKPSLWKTGWSSSCTVVWGEYVNTVPMYVDGEIVCQFENGMTWSEWVNSEFNTFGFYISDGKIAKTLSDGTVKYLKGSDSEELASTSMPYIYNSVYVYLNTYPSSSGGGNN